MRQANNPAVAPILYPRGVRASLVVTHATLAAVLMSACQDYEQQARATGAQARASVADHCASSRRSAGVPDAGDGGSELEREEAQELEAAEAAACTHGGCEASCTAYDGRVAFHRACVAACTADAECATDADCASGLRCIAAAPRVRRCRPTPTSHTPPPDGG